MSHVVAISQLQAMADYFTTAYYPYFEELREAFKLLRLTGCRIQEIFQIERWSVIDGYNVQLQPQKFNNPRQITLNSDFDNFLAAIQNQYKPFLGRTYSQLENLFHKINPYGPIYSGSKYISNYFFRYLFVRELDADGKTPEQIAVIMGYTSPQAVNNYLSAPLSSTLEVPPANSVKFGDKFYDIIKIDNIDFINENIQFNDGLDGVYYNPINPNFVDDFGYLYSPEAITRIRSHIPAGWRIPTISDMSSIVNYLQTFSIAERDLKASSSEFWENAQSIDYFNFAAKGAGIKNWSGFIYYKTKNYILMDDFDYPDFVSFFIIHDVNPAVTFSRGSSGSDFGISVRICRDSV